MTHSREGQLFAAGAAIVALHLLDVAAWRAALALAAALLAYRYAPATLRAAIAVLCAAATFVALRVVSGTHPPQALTGELRRIAPRPLLIINAAMNAPEAVVAPKWLHAAGPTAELWTPACGHTQALESFPPQYERRVVGLFDRALLTR